MYTYYIFLLLSCWWPLNIRWIIFSMLIYLLFYFIFIKVKRNRIINIVVMLSILVMDSEMPEISGIKRTKEKRRETNISQTSTQTMTELLGPCHEVFYNLWSNDNILETVFGHSRTISQWWSYNIVIVINVRHQVYAIHMSWWKIFDPIITNCCYLEWKNRTNRQNHVMKIISTSQNANDDDFYYRTIVHSI